MNKILVIDGQYYSSNKKNFKKILKEHELKWKGNWIDNEYKWISDTTTVDAEFERDSNDMFTVKATLNINGNKDFIDEVINWAGDYLLELKSGESLQIDKINMKFRDEIRTAKIKGAPEGFIRAIKRAWKKEIQSVQEV